MHVPQHSNLSAKPVPAYSTHPLSYQPGVWARASPPPVRQPTRHQSWRTDEVVQTLVGEGVGGRRSRAIRRVVLKREVGHVYGRLRGGLLVRFASAALR